MVVVGGGFGGVRAARALARANVDITIVDRTNHHLFQPLLYQVATGILSEGGIAPPIRDVLRRQSNTRVEWAEVVEIDLATRTITAVQEEQRIRTAYDSLIVAAGSRPSYYGHDDFERWAPGMKTIDDALELRGRIYGAFEAAEVEPDPEVRQQWLTFAVIGGGPTGVEMAGQITELARRSLKRNFRTIEPAQARVLLFDGAKEILGSFGNRLSSMAAADLTRMGVEVRTDTMITAIDETGLEVRAGDGTTSRVMARTKIWAAGVEASPLGRMLAAHEGVELDRTGRVRVLPDCTLPGHPEVFVVGDMMALDDLPGMAEVALQTGRHAARQVRARVGGSTTTEPFRYHDLGSLSVISRFRAVASIGRLRVGGFVGWTLWLVVHLAFLTGFKNRVGAVLHWAVSFIGRDRIERTITRQQIVARHAITDDPTLQKPAPW